MPAEKLLKTRTLRVLACIFLGRAAPLTLALAAAEGGDQDALDQAAEELARAPALPLRRLLSTYMIIDSPPRPRRRARS